MNIVFLNRLERVEGKTEERGQVYIGEDQGNWTAGWQPFDQQPDATEETWYEGVSWEELLASFRHGVAGKMVAGYRPLLDGMLEEKPFWEKPTLPQLLQCYADAQPESALAVKLKHWRKTKSQEEGRSAYLVATNKEIQLLAVFIPQTLDELGQIPGFGKIKIEKYGKQLIGMLLDESRPHSFPLQWVERAVEPETFRVWLFRLREDKYGRALVTVREKKALLSAIRDGQTLAELEKLLECSRRKLVERLEKLDEEGYDVTPIIDKELGEVPYDEWTQVQGAISKLGDRYLKPILREVYGEPAAGDQEVERRYEKLRMMRIRLRREGQKAV
ncbi:HRDC domain-containing protein [Cohnella faecalis]|nr:HRDC domain-containing protein [Cohnella faecalis]